VREYGLGEIDHLLRTHPHPPGHARVPAPRDASAEPARRLQRVHAPALGQFRPPEPAVDPRPLFGRRAAPLDRVGELGQRGLHAEQQAGAEQGVERPVVLGDLPADLPEDLGGQARRLPAQLLGEAARDRGRDRQRVVHRTSRAARRLAMPPPRGYRDVGYR